MQKVRTYGSRCVLIAAGSISSSIYVRASIVSISSTYISRCSTCIQRVREVGTYLFCSINFFFVIYIYIRTYISSAVRTYVSRTKLVLDSSRYSTWAYRYSKYLHTSIGSPVGVVRA